MKKTIKKIIVFDMDETIGSFQYFSFYFNVLFEIRKNFYIKKKDIFNIFLDLFPNIFRTNIFKIFNLIKKYKKYKNFDVILYTNNTGSREYAQSIIDYIHKKINFKLFDKIITKFGTNKIKREGFYKTYKDIQNRYKNKKIKVLFFDDYNHIDMNNVIINNIVLNPYNYFIDYNNFITIFNKINTNYRLLNENEYNNYKYYLKNNINEYDIDFNCKNINETKMIKNKILKFLKIKLNKTKKNVKVPKKYIKSKKKYIIK